MFSCPWINVKNLYSCLREEIRDRNRVNHLKLGAIKKKGRKKKKIICGKLRDISRKEEKTAGNVESPWG